MQEGFVKHIAFILIILMLFTSLALSAPMTAGYVPKAKTGTVLIDSVIYQNDVNIGIGTTIPLGTLAVDGTIYINMADCATLGIVTGVVTCMD